MPILLIPVRWETVHLVIAVGLLIVALAARIPLIGLIKRLRWVWLVILVLSLGRLWQPGGWYSPPARFVKASECLIAMSLLANTTRFVDLLQIIAGVGTPRIFVTTLALMYRYLFVLSDESHRMHRARLSRTFRTEPRLDLVAAIDRHRPAFRALCRSGPADSLGHGGHEVGNEYRPRS